MRLEIPKSRFVEVLKSWLNMSFKFKSKRFLYLEFYVDLAVSCDSPGYIWTLFPYMVRFRVWYSLRSYINKTFFEIVFLSRCCRRRLYDWLKVAPYESRVSDDDDEEWDASNGQYIYYNYYIHVKNILYLKCFDLQVVVIRNS